MNIKPPSGFDGYLSRRQAADLLGFASEFKVRQLEKAGRLRPVRGAMGSAWYARAELLALGTAARSRDATGRPERSTRTSRATGSGAGRVTDGELIGYLRERPRTVVDLVADKGIPISRAERVYRFWSTHDTHPTAEEARAGRRSERRSPDRIAHDDLLQQLRDPDPKIRGAAFEALKRKRPPTGP
jgi:hypothetical protein